MDAMNCMYFIDLLDNLHITLTLILILNIVGLAILAFTIYDEKENFFLKKWFKRGIFSLIILMPLCIVIPEKTTMYMMFSIHYMNKSDIPDKVLNILNNKLDEIINESREKIKGGR